VYIHAVDIDLLEDVELAAVFLPYARFDDRG